MANHIIISAFPMLYIEDFKAFDVINSLWINIFYDICVSIVCISISINSITTEQNFKLE